MLRNFFSIILLLFTFKAALASDFPQYKQGEGPIRLSLHMGGSWVLGSGAYIETKNPYTSKVLAQISEATAKDANNAVSAAKNAFPSWSQTSFDERADMFEGLADAIDENAEQLALWETLDSGKPISLMRSFEIPYLSDHLRKYAGYLREMKKPTVFYTGDGISLDYRKPLGVVGIITPWNYPLMMLMWKIAPALGMGNTLVVKPSEKTSITALYFASLVNKIFPAGVFNVIIGDGYVGWLMAQHQDIAHIGFTGSVATGQKIAKAAVTSNMKSFSLELGGKSPLIITKNADIKKAAKVAANGIFSNMGQNCIASSRIFVQREVHEQFIKAFVEEIANEIVIGDPLDDKTNFGPIVDQIQFDRVLSYMNIAKREGAKRVYGQDPSGKDLFIGPQVFTNVKDDMTIAKEEIFGPVAAVLTFNTFDEAIARANNSDFGLGAGLVSEDFGEFERFAREVVAGVLYWNDYNVEETTQIPFSGHKRSGFGPLSDTGKAGLLNYSKSSVAVVPGDKKAQVLEWLAKE